jgi:hypothetical protein
MNAPCSGVGRVPGAAEGSQRGVCGARAPVPLRLPARLAQGDGEECGER